MEQFKIYSPNNELLLNTLVDDNSYRLREIMGDNVLMLYFSLNEFVNIQEGAYCDFKTERYWLPESINYVKEHTEYFAYTLKLEGSIWLLRATKFKFFDYVFENGKVKPTSSFKLKFPITATPRMIADLLIANLRLKYPQYPWAVGDCIDSEPITLDYNHHSCFSILADIADKFKTEWELDKYTLHFRRVEKMKDSAIDLSYGYNNGLLGGINRLQLDNKKIINRVYVDGGDRNIDRATYGNDTLLLPKNEPITYEGIDYITDSSGSYLERVNPLSGEEDSLDISKFYPKRVGKVTRVDKINDEQGLYDVIDSTIPEDLDYSKCIIPGEQMTLKFQTGQLAGTKEFNVDYVHKDRRFKLVPINDNGLIYPQGNIIPEVGDLYAVFNMNMPEQYITIAENEALQEVVKYLWENEQSQYSYRFQLDGNFAKRNWGEIRGFLNCGFFVKFSDPQFLPEPVDVRIVAVKELVNDDKRPEITIANNISSKTFGSIINEIPSQEQATDRKDSEVREYAKRRWKDTQELIDNIMGMSDEFQENLLSSLVFEGMVFRAGAATLQYRFLADDWETSIEPDLYFDKANKQFHCPASKIKHETLEINGVKPYWTMPEYVSDNLMEVETPYYLYIKCSKDLVLTDGRLTGEADFFISNEKIKIEDLDGFYTLWVAFINSENEENDRSFTTMYGLAELLPGQLTVDTIRSSDGGSYWKALKNQFKLPGFDWNVTKKDTLTIEGFINALAAQLGGFTIDNDKIQSLGESNVMRIEYDDTIIPSFTDGHRGYFDKDGNIVPFDINNEDTWSYYFSDPIPILANDRYIEFTSFQADFKQRPIVIYDNSNKAILVPQNIGQFEIDRIEIPSNATKFRICREVENAYYNAPFVCRIFIDEKIPNIKLNGTDGSGYLAASRILWDLFGNTSFNGKFSSNYAGNRIMIDPITRSLKFVDKRDVEVMKIWFIEQSNGWVFPRLEMIVYNPETNDGKPLFTLTMSGTGISVGYGGVSYGISGSGFTARKSGESGNDPFSINYNSYLDKLYVKMRLPNNADGLDVGELYQSGGTVRIKT